MSKYFAKVITRLPGCATWPICWSQQHLTGLHAQQFPSVSWLKHCAQSQHNAWCDLYPNARASSVVVSKSDHLPLFLEIIPSTNPSHRNRFRFENLGLRVTTSREIMIESWARSRGSQLIDRVERCGKAIWRWMGRDPQGITSFREAQVQYLRALHHQNDYWRQRAKQFWLREGDTSSAYFHNSVRRRRQNNQISKLHDEDGN
nr:uncharacterized protein LOC109184133 isoform X2 [Ipomoea batatas]